MQTSTFACVFEIDRVKYQQNAAAGSNVFAIVAEAAKDCPGSRSIHLE